jgi:hypothetical protein
MLHLTTLPAPWDLIGGLLLVIVAAFLVGGFARYPYDRTRLGRMPKRTELPQSFTLIVLALIVWLAAARTTSLATLGALTFLGILSGFLGDLFMADVFDQKDHVLYGMAAFAVGHVFYMFAFREIALTFGFHVLGNYIVAIVALWAAALIIWYLMVWEPTGDRRMQYAALVYALFLASMAAYATGIALHEMAFYPLAIGAILFLLSDALIAARLFGGRRFRYMGDVIWTTYIIAQTLIVIATPVALALLAG